MKSQIIRSIVLLLSFSVVCSANQVSGELQLPNDESAKYTVDTSTGEYNVDFRTIMNFRLSLNKNQIKGLNCSGLDDLISAASPLKTRDFATVGQPVQLNIMAVSQDELKAGIIAQLQDRRVQTPALVNKSNLRFDQIQVDYSWSKSAATVRAGNQSLYVAEEHIRSILKQPTVLAELNLHGNATLSIEHLPLLCDLARGAVTIVMSVRGVQYSTNRTTPSLSTSAILTVNRAALKSQDVWQANPNAQVSSSNNNILINAGRLAFSMAKNGYDTSNTKPDDFVLVFSAMFDGRKLISLDQHAADQVVDQLSTPEYKPEPLSFSQKIKIEVN